MTKHLRIFMLTLFTIVCALGGYAEKYQYVFSSKVINSVGETQLGDINWTLTTSNGKMYASYDTDRGQQLCSNGSPANPRPSYIYLSTTGFSGNITSVKVNTSGGSGINAKLGISVDDKEFGNEKTITKTATDYEFTGSATGKLSINWTSINKGIYIKSIEVTYEATTGKPAPALSFAEASVTKNLNESGGIISLQTISKPADLDASAITYKSSDNETAEVDGGNIYMYKTGTVTITATSAETDKYAAGTASYKLVIVDPSSAETKSVTFIAGQQMGTQDANGKKDEMSQDGVTVLSTNAALAAKSTLDEYTYRFYMRSQTTISTKVGKITEIYFVGSGNKDRYSLTNLSSTDNNYTSTQDDYGVWTGSAKEVVFNASTQVRAVQIIVTIVMPKSYTLDETSTQNVIENCSYANVTLKRTVESSHWNTFCVPFSLTADQITKYFGEGTLLRTYEGDFNNNIANFKVVDNIEAGKPYLLKPGNAVVENPTFEEVSIVATNLDTYKNPQAVGDAAMFQMKGIYNHVTLAQNETNLYLGEGNLFYYPADAEACEMNGLRAYFIVPENTDINKLRANIDGTATSLGAIFNTEENNAPVYNLQGQRVGSSLGSLKSGIYIKNGKKVVVK